MLLGKLGNHEFISIQGSEGMGAAERVAGLRLVGAFARAGYVVGEGGEVLFRNRISVTFDALAAIRALHMHECVSLSGYPFLFPTAWL